MRADSSEADYEGLLTIKDCSPDFSPEVGIERLQFTEDLQISEESLQLIEDHQLTEGVHQYGSVETESAIFEKAKMDAILFKAAQPMTSQVGTTTYAAPERMASSEHDSKADMDSLGVVLYELYEPFYTIS